MKTSDTNSSNELHISFSENKTDFSNSEEAED